jgi:hypothetical protein
MVELTVLQTVQEARFAEGKPVPDVPLTPEQISLVFEYSQYSAWLHHFGSGWFFGHEEAVRQLATGEAAEFHDVPPGLAELAVELSRPENAIIWELMPGASDNDTFLGPNGTYRVDGGRDHILSDDAQALAIQMILLSKIGPHHADLAYGNDNIHEDEVDRWLDENRDNPDVPPALIDLVETGRSFGLGEDTFGWEEFGEIIGWVGLAAAITATIVYSGGTAAPLWVQAGLVGLAGLEAFAFIQADDPFDAALAGLGGAADLLTAARLIRRARSAATYASGPDAGRILGETKDELVQLASNSTIRDLQVLAAEADGLTPTEFLARYAEVVADNKGQIARDLVASGQSPAEAARIVDEIQLPAGSTDAFGYADAEQLRLLNDPARRPTTQIRTDGQGRQVRIAHGDRAGEYVTVINSRNVEDGYVTLADGTRVEFDGDGFPVLDSRYDTIIDDKHLGTANEAQHFAAANENLYNAILRDPSLVETMGLRDDQLAHIWPKADGTFRTKPPDDLTWHHHQDTGRMQLVDRIDHASIRHTGGMRIWGGGRD